MNCSRAQKYISLLLDGEATPEQKRLLDFHLMGCSVCRRSLEMSRDISRVTRKLQAPAPPEDLEDRVRRMIAEGSDRRSPGLGRRSAVLTIPAAAAILMIALTLLPLSSPGESLVETTVSTLADYQPKSGGLHLSSKSGIRTAPLSEYTRQASLISF
ncbi:MAG: hypothetical protein AVO35_03745 [Candidatus Aegiribacteria sp. MLS_C]|nr:MAG: hypothetical protein AVO35_03745 [Candidatus Aegiribacteria sp. MLS_C]